MLSPLLDAVHVVYRQSDVDVGEGFLLTFAPLLVEMLHLQVAQVVAKYKRLSYCLA